MYVCVCNAVTEDDVRGCMLDGGCRGVREVKDACGWKPGCGSCTRRLYSLVSEVQTATDLVDAITGGPLPPVLPADAPVPPLGVPAEAEAERQDAEAASAAAQSACVVNAITQGAAQPPRAVDAPACGATGPAPSEVLVPAERVLAPVRSRWLRDTAA
ncbi:(2Fe-2S)-binding protein [Actinomadura oligospora]|uniref:(2Fe-2S)-binding protein n=1 Tax=Actinomadura oligospora TaxID=111804 RepID=UPI0004B74B57|nr:(2Fe-2S)-binding protein [Actinomadura oligospora]